MKDTTLTLRREYGKSVSKHLGLMVVNNGRMDASDVDVGEKYKIQKAEELLVRSINLYHTIIIMLTCNMYFEWHKTCVHSLTVIAVAIEECRWIKGIDSGIEHW